MSNLFKDIKAVNHFPNLDSVRFYAAFMVIIHHFESAKESIGFTSYYTRLSFLQTSGKIGVVLFFVLSGFLIFSLLFKERENFNTIDIKSFYIRRILRIWPLYYLILLLAYFVFSKISILPPEHYAQSKVLGPLLYAFILPNVAAFFYIMPPYSAQVWSLGVEEQMYIVSPLIAKRKKMVFSFLCGIVVLTLLTKCIIYIYCVTNKISWYRYSYFFNCFSYDCIAIGGIASYLYFIKKSSFISFLFKKSTQLVIYTLFFIFYFYGYHNAVFQFELFAILFAIIILNLAVNPNTIFNVETKVTSFLGKISFGLYMFHPIITLFASYFYKKINITNCLIQYIVLFLLVIGVSYLSYTFFEKPFLKLKHKFQKV